MQKIKYYFIVRTFTEVTGPLKGLTKSLLLLAVELLAFVVVEVMEAFEVI